MFSTKGTLAKSSKTKTSRKNLHIAKSLSRLPEGNLEPKTDVDSRCQIVGLNRKPLLVNVDNSSGFEVQSVVFGFVLQLHESSRLHYLLKLLVHLHPFLFGMRDQEMGILAVYFSPAFENGLQV